MAFGAAKTSDADISQSVQYGEFAARDGVRVRDDDAPVRALLDRLRNVLAQQGVRESFSSEQEGFYFVIEGRDEVSLHYHDIERNGDSARAKSLTRLEAGLLNCCAELMRNGHAMTLVMSPRTRALHVRFAETHERRRDSAT